MCSDVTGLGNVVMINGETINTWKNIHTFFKNLMLFIWSAKTQIHFSGKKKSLAFYIVWFIRSFVNLYLRCIQYSLTLRSSNDEETHF